MRSTLVAPFERGDEAHEALLRFATQRDVEAALERFLGTHGRVCAAGHERPRAAAGELVEQTIRVPHPAREEAHADDCRAERFCLADDVANLRCRAARGGIEHADLGAARDECGGDVLQSEQR